VRMHHNNIDNHNFIIYDIVIPRYEKP